jgi:hypothetical protein
VGLERGPLSLVSTTEEVLARKSSGSGLENRDYGSRGFVTLNYAITSIRKQLALTSPTSGDHWFCVVRSRTQAKDLFVVFCFVCFVLSLTSSLFLCHFPARFLPMYSSFCLSCRGSICPSAQFHTLCSCCNVQCRMLTSLMPSEIYFFFIVFDATV